MARKYQARFDSVFLNRAVRTIARMALVDQFPTAREIASALELHEDRAFQVVETLENMGEITCQRRTRGPYRGRRKIRGCRMTGAWFLESVPVMRPGRN